MAEYKYKYTQVLNLISEAQKENRITKEDRKQIKECILMNEPDLTLEIEQYNKDKDLSRLIETLKVVAGITEMSSPLDNSVFKRKKEVKIKGKKGKSKAPEENKDGNDIGFDAVECDLGNSPDIKPKKLKKAK